jgi:predicted nucleic acid-binding protein
MLICIDSCVFIRRFQRNDSTLASLFTLINPNLRVVIPRLVALEVTRNLTTQQQAQFYRLFQIYPLTSIIDEPVPLALVHKYIQLNLPAKADAFIGAFAEWQKVNYLISDNRHFLRLQATAFQVVSANDFVSRVNKS